MQPLYIHQPNNELQDEITKGLLNSHTIHLYQPIVNSENKVQAFELKPIESIKALYEYGYSRNVYLYELRSVLDAIRLLERHSENQYLAIVNVSSNTIEEDDFFNYIREIKTNNDIKQRVVICVRHDSEIYPNHHQVILNRLSRLANCGYKIMVAKTTNSFPLELLNGNISFFKLPISNYQNSHFSHMQRAIFAMCSEFSIDLIYSNIDSETALKSLDLNERTYLQGEYIGKASKSLINNKYDII